MVILTQSEAKGLGSEVRVCTVRIMLSWRQKANYLMFYSNFVME